MGAVSPSDRLKDRARGLFHTTRHVRTAFFVFVIFVVAVNTVIDVLAGYSLYVGDLPEYRAWLAISLGLTALINAILIMLVWMLFETLSRVERESDRLQTFMDSSYRRGLLR